MTPNDRQKFAAIITGFAELKGKSLSRAALDLYWHAMQDWSIADFETAAAILLRKCQFMPMPKDFDDLRSAARPTAGEAWAAVLQHLKGGYRTGGLSPEIDRAVAALGGYRTLAMMPVDQLPWQAKRFAEAFAEVQDVAEARAALPEVLRAALGKPTTLPAVEHRPRDDTQRGEP